MNERLQSFLEAKAAKYRPLSHPAAVTAQEQAAAMHASGWSTAKVVVVKERDGYVMAVVPACCVIDLDRLKGLIGHGALRLATVDEIQGVVRDCAPGAIPPFGALYGLPSYVDRALFRPREVTLPAGDFATSIRMRSGEYRRLAGAKEGDFAVLESLVPAPARLARASAWKRRTG
jgi:Ala-tRNA(Pro) deacylase